MVVRIVLVDGLADDTLLHLLIVSTCREAVLGRWDGLAQPVPVEFCVLKQQTHFVVIVSYTHKLWALLHKI